MSNKKFTIGNTNKSKFTIKNPKENNKIFTIVNQPMKPQTGSESDEENLEGGRFKTPIGEQGALPFSNNPFTLDTVIKELRSERDARITNGSVQKIVRLSARTGRTTRFRIPFLSGNERIFFVDTRSKMTSPLLAYPINLPNHGDVIFNLKFEVGYLATYDLNSFVEALAVNQNLAAALNDYVNQWVNEVIQNEGTAVITNFFEIRRRLELAITQKARLLGISLRVIEFKLNNEDVVDRTYEIEKSDYVRIQLQNLNEYVEIKYQANVSCYKPQKLKAILNFKEIDKLPLQISKYLRMLIKEFSFGQLYQGFTPELIGSLKESVNIKLMENEMGWKIDSLVITKKDSDFEIPEHLTIKEEPMTFPIKTGSNQTYDVTVFNTLVLNLNNSDKAKEKYEKTKNLGSLAREMLQRVINNNLLNASYDDLIINKAVYENKIRGQLSEWAYSIGYTINNFFTIPDVEIEKLGGRFEFSTDKNIEYKTNIGDKVKLKVKLNNVELKQLENIRHYLTPNINIVEEMKKVIVVTVTNFLHDKDPNDYYINFETTLQDNLKNEIKKSLVDEFFINENVVILLERINTELIERSLKLRQGFHEFKFESFGSLEYNALFSINAIDPDGWQIFQNHNFADKETELASIKQHLRYFLETQINDNLSITFKDVKHEQFLEGIRQFLIQSENHIKEKFGLLIEITGIKREATLAEQQLKALHAANHKNIIGQINSSVLVADEINNNRVLDYQRLRAELQTAKDQMDDERVKEIEKELKSIDKRTFKDDSLTNKIQQLEEGLDSNNSLNRLPSGEKENSEEDA